MEGVRCVRPRGSDGRQMPIARPSHGAAASEPARRRRGTNYVTCGAPCKMDERVLC